MLMATILTLVALLILPLALAAGEGGAGEGSGSEAVSVEVREHLGRPLVFVNGQPQALPLYCPAGQPHNFFKQVDRFLKLPVAGFFIYTPRGKLPESAGDWAAPPFWVGDRIGSEPILEAATSTLDEQAEYILQRKPDALIFVRLSGIEPKSWRDLHPDELARTAAGKVLPMPSNASDLYWEMEARCMEAEIRYCESRPWGRRVIGYWTGMRTEGTHEFLIEGEFYDHSPAMRKKWLEFLKAKYRTDEALRVAWGDPKVVLADAPLPVDSLRGGVREVSNLLFWQAPPQNQAYRDYLLLQKDLFHAAFRRLAAAGPKATSNRRFFALDALKQTLAGWENQGFFNEKYALPWAYHDMLGGSGSLEATTLFDAPGFGALITPYDYQARGVGGVFEPEGMVDSCILRGKPFFAEGDVRTWKGLDKGQYFSAKDRREFEALAWRKLATALTRGFNSYWMDLFTDWYDDGGMQEVLKRWYEVWNESLAWPHEDVPGIAVVLDDTACLETNGNGAYDQEAVMWEFRTGLARCGVPYRIYQFEDLKLDRFPPHRLLYFPNLFRVTDERLEVLKRKVFRDGHVVLWGPGSGITDGKSLSEKHAQRLTGFEFEPLLNVNHPRRVQIQRYDHPITAELQDGTVLGGPLSYGPILFPKSGERLGLAWTKQGRTVSGLAVKTLGRGARGAAADGGDFGPGDWASVFTTAVPLPAELWRGLARYAGAHVYSETNDIVLADRTIVALHGLRPGERVLRLPHSSEVHDVISGKRLAERTTEIRFTLDGPATRVFRVVPH
jgi:hypothetical protein